MAVFVSLLKFSVDSLGGGVKSRKFYSKNIEISVKHHVKAIFEGRQNERFTDMQ